jgi:hypothetical protein
MEEDLFKNIKQSIDVFQESLRQHLPALEADVNQIIKSKNQNTKTIEHTLDTLLSLTSVGIGENIFVKLLEYYKTVDADGAAFYWKEYDKEND